jgi:hypothetical protein
VRIVLKLIRCDKNSCGCVRKSENSYIISIYHCPAKEYGQVDLKNDNVIYKEVCEACYKKFIDDIKKYFD